MLEMIFRCQSTQCSLQCVCFALLAWSEIWNLNLCGVVCLCVQIQTFVLHIPFPLSLCLSQPRGRAGGRVCCFSAGRGAEVRRTVTYGTVLSDIHSLALPHAH